MSIEIEDYQSLIAKIEALETQVISLEKDNKKLLRNKLYFELNEAKLLDIQRLALIYSWEANVVSRRLKCSDQLLDIIDKKDGDHLFIEDLFSAIHFDDIALFEEFYDVSVGQGKPFELIHRLILPNGQERIVKHYCKTFFLDNGMPLKSMGLMQDITQLKKTEDKLRTAIAEAQAADQAKSDFLANMSHELRTPLNGILGYAQILERSPGLAEKERHGVDIIHQCGSHLLTLINDVLDLAKIEAGKLELISAAKHLPSVLQSIFEICRIKAEQKGIKFIYEPIGRLPDGVFVDETRLRQVLINLLSNAIKFTDQGFVIFRVEVLSTSENKTSLLFQVIDTGVGILMEDCAKIFSAFEQVGVQKKQSEGTGLGLAISQRIVQMMGGTIQVKSQLGQGSEFFFTTEFLLAEDWVERQLSLSNYQRITGYQGERRQILVVDDRWENRAVLLNLLEPLGFSVFEAEQGQAGLKMMHRLKPDLVITDLLMPVMDGYDFLACIRCSKEFKMTRVIVSSASVTRADQQMALDAGGNAFLAKPIDAKKLFQALADQLQIDWTYAPQPHRYVRPNLIRNDIVLPSKKTIEELLAMAENGLITALRNQLKALVKSDEKYVQFVDTILQLAKQFLVEEIEELLNHYLELA